jgi:DNA polymerase III alpha subunit
MSWLNVRTGYSFGQVYGHLDKVAEKCAKLGDFAGIADLGNTFAHIPWEKACKKVGIKPIYGVQIPVVDDLGLRERRQAFNWMTLIARNTNGLREVYRLVDISFQQFYYRQRISYEQINATSDNIFLLSGVAPRLDLIKRNVFMELSPMTPYSQRDAKLQIACIDNYYPDAEDSRIYEPFADERKLERKTSPIHILTKEEWLNHLPKGQKALNNLKKLADLCNATLPHAPMVEYVGKDKIESWCLKGAVTRNLDIESGPYAERYKREIKLIKDKEYADYFLVVADAIRYSKTKMVVGPGRGSSAGSLVCFLMGITEIDPLKYDLLFERFIDVNRFDLPDIDIDFQDDKRYLVIKYLEKKYGKENVAQIANINRFKPKSAIKKFSQSLGVSLEDVKELKDSINDELGGKSLIKNAFEQTEIGIDFLKKHPSIEVVQHIENHVSHTGIHAAGILVCNSPITDYCGINSRDKKRIGMLDKNDAESINLLKIDALGLRTLTIFATVCDQLNKPYSWLDDIPLDDSLAFKVFNDHRFNGLFQFNGDLVTKLSKQMPIEGIEDISALCALGRPGPLSSGASQRYVQVRSGAKSIRYLSSHKIVKTITENTNGVIVYQEQVMMIVKELGKLSWEDTSKIRKAIAKSKGEEIFNEMYAKFKVGVLENGLSEDEAKEIWEQIKTMGSYSFNKSHSVAYGVISYTCAFLKAHYPLEFLVACLRHSNSDRDALKILRDAVESDGIKHKYFDAEKSMEKWSVIDGVLYGGFESLAGFGDKKAKQAVKLRAEGKAYPKGMQTIISSAISPFKYLNPAKELYGDYYTDPGKNNLNNPATPIGNINGDGTFVMIGCMVKKTLRDANEACFVAKRDGKHLEGNTSSLNITIEDDTGSIMCKISTKDYMRFGKEIAEKDKEDKDWYLVYGNRINGWGIIFVKNIKRITRKI